ncbi:MAG: HAD hydrolase-like protein [Alicyclobacillus sp.]|nr:HAD hydrolase-like protein [Alicyclobacillus sp.]
MFQTILFDIDGVMLSEERYFDASAITVWELLTSPQYTGVLVPELGPFRTDLSADDIALIRRAIFVDDAVFHAMKQRGINANWDMVYLQTACQVTLVIQQWLKAASPESVRASLHDITRDGWTRSALARLGQALREAGVQVRIDFGQYLQVFAEADSKVALFARLDDWLAEVAGPGVPPYSADRILWRLCADTFQEWYVGDEYSPDTHQPGKPGFLTDEVPIVDPSDLARLFSDLRANGCVVGIATGRPSLETRVPLRHYGWLEQFDEARISTASDVLDAERAHPDAGPLSKPHPFSYLRSYLGTTDAAAVLGHALPIAPDAAASTLVVGDSVADLLAARAIGCRFAAVLTGLEGQAARSQFEQLQADYIFDDVLGLRALFDQR